MQTNAKSFQVVADIKCYYCGHISGQMVGQRDGRNTHGNFVPRPGFAGSMPRPGSRIRCERCGGPVFLEDTTLIAIGETEVYRKLYVSQPDDDDRQEAA